MAEITLTRIKSVYGQIKGYYENLPGPLKSEYYYTVELAIGTHFNTLLDELGELTKSDYSLSKVDISKVHGGMLPCQQVKMKMGSVVSRLQIEYDFDQPSKVTKPAIAIFNNNESNISININFSIDDLISAATNDDEKDNLEIISSEIKKPDGNWDKIKQSLGWILNYSKDLSLKILPIILDYYLKHPS